MFLVTRCGEKLCSLFPQTSQGVQPKRFKRLPELVSSYLQPNQGLVTTLLYAVDREETVFTDEKDYSGTNQACMNTFTAHFFFFFMLAFFYFVIRWGGWKTAPPSSFGLHFYTSCFRNAHRQVQSQCLGLFFCFHSYLIGWRDDLRGSLANNEHDSDTLNRYVSQGFIHYKLLFFQKYNSRLSIGASQLANSVNEPTASGGAVAEAFPVDVILTFLKIVRWKWFEPCDDGQEHPNDNLFGVDMISRLVCFYTAWYWKTKMLQLLTYQNVTNLHPCFCYITKL